ncbi:polysaccharide deacetylase family protein [Pilimelia columellifera]|uniref:NodB homology domain-containing protein n=1 Tax=Pilimelia columellifera subsp. columellifera TaxID=706583 RepID=A0ABP6A5V8_9ACTN
MTRRLTLATGAMLSVLLLIAQAVDGWASRPGQTPVPAAIAQPVDTGQPQQPSTPTTPATPKPPKKPGTVRPVTPKVPAAKPAGRPASGPFARGVQLATRGNGVALTYDDGPSAHTPQVLALLRANGVKATFCLVGTAVQEHPDLVRQIVREGHTLCNHSWNHEFKLGRQSAEAIRANMTRTNNAIRQVVPGAKIPFFRHPGGNFTPDAISIGKELGMASVGWTVDPRDWEKPPAKKIHATVLRDSRPAGIILLHDGGGDRSNTVAASKTLIPALKSKLRIVPLR